MHWMDLWPLLTSVFGLDRYPYTDCTAQRKRELSHDCCYHNHPLNPDGIRCFGLYKLADTYFPCGPAPCKQGLLTSRDTAASLVQ